MCFLPYSRNLPLTHHRSISTDSVCKSRDFLNSCFWWHSVFGVYIHCQCHGAWYHSCLVSKFIFVQKQVWYAFVYGKFTPRFGAHQVPFDHHNLQDNTSYYLTSCRSTPKGTDSDKACWQLQSQQYITHKVHIKSFSQHSCSAFQQDNMGNREVQTKLVRILRDLAIVHNYPCRGQTSTASGICWSFKNNTSYTSTNAIVLILRYL